MGNSQSTQNIKINFEDVQYIIGTKHPEQYILINTLDETEQHCLIKNTVSARVETELLNNVMKNTYKDAVKIVIYGRNSNDEKLSTKYNQLLSLGFYKVYIYMGGMFEWLLLQDIYGENEFPTTKKELDILKYKPHKVFTGYN
jgi:hypothetical protein